MKSTMRLKTKKQLKMTKWHSACYKRMMVMGILKLKWPKDLSNRQLNKLIGLLSRVGFKLGMCVILMTACSQSRPATSVTTATSATTSVFVKGATKGINRICILSARVRYLKGKAPHRIVMSWSLRHICVARFAQWAWLISTNVCTSVNIKNVVRVLQRATQHTGAKLVKKQRSMTIPGPR